MAGLAAGPGITPLAVIPRIYAGLYYTYAVFRPKFGTYNETRLFSNKILAEHIIHPYDYEHIVATLSDLFSPDLIPAGPLFRRP